MMAASGLLLAAAGQAYGFPLPPRFEIGVNNLEWLGNTDEIAETDLTATGVTSHADRVEDNWAVFQIESISDRNTGETPYTLGSGGEFLYGIAWGIAIAETRVVSAIPDLLTQGHNVAATSFADETTEASNGVTVPDLDNADGDADPTTGSDIGFAVFVGSTNTWTEAINTAPTARVTSTLINGLIPQFPNITCDDANGNDNGVCDAGEGRSLAGLFAFDTGIAAPFTGGVVVPDVRVTTDLDAADLTRGTGSGYANLVNPDGSGVYDGTTPYGSAFDNLVIGSQPEPGEPPLYGNVTRDLQVNFRFDPPDAGTAAAVAGWDLVSFDPLRGAAVPEPTSLMLMGVSLAGLGFARRRTNKQAAR
jgi:hypothetical protein